MMKLTSIASVFLLSIFYVNVYAELTTTISRVDFPSGFVFGAGTSAYQAEGAAAEDGRKPSIWDTYSHQEGNFEKGTGDVASDQYHHFKDDVKLMDKMGVDAYRFSISWSRLIPDGRGAVNPKGLTYYNDLLDELVNHGIEAHVTLSHFDLPQSLQDEYGGFLSPKFIDDFTAYAAVCFQEFGDRVNSWMTFNEPNTKFGYTRCFSPFDSSCSNGDLQREAYIPGHNILLAHAAAVHLYRTTYQEKQKGRIGITFLAVWYEPLNNSPLDISTAKQKFVFQFDWFMNPIIHGRYPALMRKICGAQLPNITQKELTQIKGSYDFIGINYYGSIFIQGEDSIHTRAHADRNWRYGVKDSRGMDDYQYLAPGVGLQKVLQYIKLKYQNPPVLIHENGYGTAGDDSSDPAAQKDTARIWYLDIHLQTLLSSIRNGTNVKGYFVWAFLDCFELFKFYDSRYGLYGVDFNDKNRRRYPRLSANWYSAFLAKTGIIPEPRTSACTA